MTVEEVSHGSIFGHAATPAQHILYNGKDHYDALTEIADFTGMAPAWPQPPPPVYFSKVASLPTTQAATQHEDEDEEDDDNQLGFMDALLKVPVAESSLHPHRRVEDTIKDGRGGNTGSASLSAKRFKRSVSVTI